jgi:hypothetical protein
MNKFYGKLPTKEQVKGKYHDVYQRWDLIARETKKYPYKK